MGLIFISHSSANNAQAMAIRDWLVANGWNDYFLDLDPQRGLAAGQRWQEELKRAAERCELVIFLISPQWASSQWCVAEFLVAKQINKQIFGVIVEPTPMSSLPVELTGEYQVVDLTAGDRNVAFSVEPPGGGGQVAVRFSQEGLDGLRIGLRKSGLDPSYFQWPPESDPERSPYRGLRALEHDDAGVFFGRDGVIVSGMDRLRGMREPGGAQMLVILGASGSGKSSFMRAGLLPRLERDDLHFLPLPVVRPERAAITGEHGLVAALETSFAAAKVRKSRADIRAAVNEGGEALRALLNEIVAPRSRSGASVTRPPTLVIAVDQAEELFQAEAGAEAGQLLALVRDAVTGETPLAAAIFSIRSDSYERLQKAPQLEGIKPEYLNLPPMPVGAFGEVIKGPARRLAETTRPLRVDDRLVDALLQDIEADGIKDALPLLSFTLERLYLEHGGDGDLRLSEYESLGRIKGSIEAAVEAALKAADSDPAVPRDRAARIALLRRGLVPWLTGIDPDTGELRRRVARMSEIPAEARPLIDLLIDQRLLSTDVDSETKEVTVEPAHEALLRQWGLLEGWMAEDLPLLTTLEGVKRAARDWAANQKNPEWINHAGKRLADAEAAAAREDLGNFLQPTERAYLIAARAAETERQRAEIGSLRRQRMIVGAAAVVLALAAGAMHWLWTVAESSFRQAASSLGVVEAGNLLDRGDVEGAVAAAMGAMDILETAETRSAALRALMELPPNLVAVADVANATGPVAWATSEVIAYATEGAVAFATAGGAVSALQPVAVEARMRALVPAHGGGVTAIMDRGAAVVIDASGAVTPIMPQGEARLATGQHAASANGSGEVIGLAVANLGGLVSTCVGGNCTAREIATGLPSAVAVDHAGGAVAVANENGGIVIDGAAPSSFETSIDGRIVALDWSAEGRLVAGTASGALAVVDAATQAIVFQQLLSEGAVTSARWSPAAASTIGFVCDTANLCVGTVDGSDLGVAPAMFGPRAVTGFGWSPEGSQIATTTGGQLRVWSLEQNRDVRFSLSGTGAAALDSIAVSPDGQTIAAGDVEGNIWLWSAVQPVQPRLLPAPEGISAIVSSLAWSADGLLAAAYQETAVAIFDGAGALVRVDRPRGVFRSVTFVGTQVAAPLRDGRIALVPSDPAAAVTFIGPLVGEMEFWGMAGHADGRRIFASYTDGALRVWNLDAPEAPTDLVSPEAAAGTVGGESLSFSPDGRLVAVSRSDNAVVIYEADTGEVRHHLEVASAGTNTVAFSPDGARFAALTGAGRLYLWDIAGSSAALVFDVDAAPARSEAGQMDADLRAPWLAWHDNETLAIPMVSGTVQMLSIDPQRWRARAAALGLSG